MTLLNRKTIIGRFETVNPQLARKYVFAAGYVTGKEVLDLGCASGYGSYYLTTKGKAISVTGADISKKAIAHAAKNYRLPQLKFIQAGADRLPFDNGQFDIVVSLEVIEHVENYEKYLQEIKRVLKPRGTLILSTPNKAVSSPGLKYPLMASHVKEFYIEELKKILKQHFKTVTLRGETPQSLSYQKEMKQHFNSKRFIIQKIFSQIRIVRSLTRFTPQRFNDLFTGGKARPATLKLEEVKITRSPQGATTILVIASKAKQSHNQR